MIAFRSFVGFIDFSVWALNGSGEIAPANHAPVNGSAGNSFHSAGVMLAGESATRDRWRDLVLLGDFRLTWLQLIRPTQIGQIQEVVRCAGQEGVFSGFEGV